ncbi:hypothetical protein TREMEDRAFT_39110 [Tremella mesenterica DSM 1558]|uniref:uncharacterized protein n=1 Tax=Tremella mesenterica (strain ATCC 24925 / CBS 8224 / DSM 1558 / NBRC 9311 / NRRL Y-6157 / RJB 2259-6 / UBC 559-6) TaxID=578456 RepID=UPI0003F4A197|nr:uncharacterized protein TREMEDRAFT_39110 [Tremella mesenterica DSM 1558]EIW69536.1 hypothetical protein TREMEDRAFT_39110 [Tremella mesenterica DSM 1558]
MLEDPFEYSHGRYGSGGVSGKQKTMPGYKFANLSPPLQDEKEELIGYTADLHEVIPRPISEARRSLYPPSPRPVIKASILEQHPDMIPPDTPSGASKSSPSTPVRATFVTLFSLTDHRDWIINFFPGLIIACAAGLVPPYMSLVVGEAFAVFEAYPLDLSGTSAQRAALLHGVSNTSIKLTVAGIVGVITNYLRTVIWVRHGETHVGRLRRAVYDGVQRKGMEWFDLGMGTNETAETAANGETIGAGGMMSKFTKETDDVRIATSQAMGLVWTNLAVFVLCFILAMIKSPVLTLVTLSTIPLLVLVQIIVQTVVGPVLAGERRATAEASTNIERATNAIATVKAHNAQGHESARFNKIADRANTSMVRLAVVWGFMFSATGFLSLSTFVVGFWYGAKLVQEHKVSNGDVMTVFWACLIGAGYLQNVVPQLTYITRGKNSMASLLTVIQDSPSRPTSTLSSPTSPTFPIQRGSMHKKIRQTSLRRIRPPRCRGEFNFRHVSFAYPSRPDNPVLRDVTLFVPPGETTFIVGGSGSGKSTIAQLLLRLYQPSGGEITLDDQDFRYLDEGFTKENIAAVQQGCILFDLSIHDNVAMGVAGSGPDPKTSVVRRPQDVSRQEVVEACKMAMIHDFIASLPEGYETNLGTGGSQLSGGQKQRLAIARAKIRDPTILILDEATSALDATSRVLVFDSLQRWRKNRTTVVITHDLSQIRPDDFVYVMQDGIVAEQGFRVDLSRKTPLHGQPLGIFASMAAEQASDPVPEKFEEYVDGSMIEEVLEDDDEIPVRDQRFSRPRTPSFGPGLRPGSAMYLGILDDYSKGLRSSSIDPTKRDSRHLSVRPLSSAQKRLSWSPQELDIRGSRHSLSRAGSRSSVISTRVSRQLFPSDPSTIHRLSNSDGFLQPPIQIEKARVSLVPYDFKSRTLSQNLEDELKSSSFEVITHPSEEISNIKPKSIPSIFIVLYRYYFTIPRKPLLLLGLLSAIAHGVTTPLWASYLSKLMQFAGVGDSSFALTKYALIVLGLAAAQAIAIFFEEYCLYAVSGHWATELRKTAYDGVLQQDKAWFDRSENSPAVLVQSIMKDTDDIKGLVSSVMGRFLVAVVMISVGVIWALVVQWRLTLIGVALAPVFVAVIVGNESLIRNAEVRSKARREAVAKVFYESIANIRGIRSMTLEGVFREKFEIDSATARRGGRHDAWLVAIGTGATGGMILFCQALLNWAGAKLMLNGHFNYVIMLQVYNLVLFSLTFGSQMLDFIPTMSKAKVAASDFHRFLKLSTTVSESSGTLRYPISGNVTFSHVSFSYPTRPDVLVLQDLTFSLSPGECIAIVGPSGCGKSTIASLLQRLYEPTSGGIKMDRFDLSQADVKWLRNHIAVVSQSANLFDATISENIAYGSDVPLGEIHRAAQAANIHDFIQSLPDGYDTHLGENASLISGGQAQRLQIARALVRRSNVLILDECTSALDVENQRAILDTIVRIKDTRTTIFITHSLEAMKRCDKIICLGEGRVVEQGTFEELSRKGGVFAQLMRTGEWE